MRLNLFSTDLRIRPDEMNFRRVTKLLITHIEKSRANCGGFLPMAIMRLLMFTCRVIGSVRYYFNGDLFLEDHKGGLNKNQSNYIFTIFFTMPNIFSSPFNK